MIDSKALRAEAARWNDYRDDPETSVLVARIAALKEDLRLRDTCTACEASLQPPELAMEDGAPHCTDCAPEDDQRAAWLDARRKNAEALRATGAIT